MKDAAESITEQDPARDLERLPGPKLYCVCLDVDTLRKPIASCKELQDSKAKGECNTR